MRTLEFIVRGSLAAVFLVAYAALVFDALRMTQNPVN